MGLIIVPGEDPGPGAAPEGGYVEVGVEELRGWVAHAVAGNKKVLRTSRVQDAMDALAELALEDDEVCLAAAVLLVSAFRGVERIDVAVALLMEAMAAMRESGQLDRRCRMCGCAEDRARPDGRDWTYMDLCSACDRRLKDAGRAAMAPGEAGGG